MVYDFQAGGFSPLINPMAINKSTKQQEPPYGDTHLLLLQQSGARVPSRCPICLKNGTETPYWEVEKFSRICILVSRKEKEKEEEERVLGSAPRGVPNMHVPKQGQELGGGVKSSSKMVTLKLQAITSLNPFVNFHFANENIRLCHLVKKEKGGWNCQNLRVPEQTLFQKLLC